MKNLILSRQGAARNSRLLFAGADFGTSKVGLTIVDSSGSEVWADALDLPESHRSTGTGLLVQRPSEWLEMTRRLFALAAEEIDVSAIAAVGITATTPTFVFVRGDGSVHLDEAVMWNDPHREGPSDPLGRNVGWRKLVAVFKINPRLLRQVAFIVDAPNYLAYTFTGRMTAGAAGLAQKMAWNDESEFERDKLIFRDPEEVLSKIPNRIVATGDVVGLLDEPTAKTLQLRTGIPVVHAAYDSAAALLGGGLYLPSDELLLTVGTSVGFYMIPQPSSDQSMGSWVPRRHVLPHGQTVVMGGFEAGLQSIRLVHERLILTNKAQNSNEMLEEVAAQGEMLEPPTTFALPFGGVPLRAPLPDVLLPTAVYSNSHFPSIQAELVAMRRGVAYFVRYAIGDLSRRGVAVKKLHIVGGGTKSPSFCRLLADASGIPVCIFGSNAASAGAAILAATVNENARERCHFVNRRKEGRVTLRPNSDQQAKYDAGYRLFRHHLHAALRQTDEVLGACPEYVI